MLAFSLEHTLRQYEEQLRPILGGWRVIRTDGIVITADRHAERKETTEHEQLAELQTDRQSGALAGGFLPVNVDERHVAERIAADHVVKNKSLDLHGVDIRLL